MSRTRSFAIAGYMVKSLSELLHPHDPQLLLVAVTAHERLYLHTERASVFGGFLPWDRINAAITAENIASGLVELSRGSFILPLETMITWQRADNHRPRLKLASLNENCRKGLSVVINGIQRTALDIALMNAVLERELRSPVHTNVYASFGSGGALKPHWDDHNVLILHTHGRKLWRCWDRMFELPVDQAEARVAAELGPPDWEQVLEPGDILYLPRGQVHQAEIVDGKSCAHMTVTITPPRLRAIGLALAKVCEQAPIGRSDLPTVASAHAKAEWMSEARALLHAAVDRLDIDEVLASLDRSREPLQAGSLGRLDKIDDSMVFQPLLLRPTPPAPPGGRSIKIRAGSQEWILDATEATVLHYATRHHCFTIGDLLPSIQNASREALEAAVLQMISKGLLVLSPGQ